MLFRNFRLYDADAERFSDGQDVSVEGGKIIALAGADGNISLEPAGQLELSGAPLENLHQTCAEAARHLDQCKAVGEQLGLIEQQGGLVGKGCVGEVSSPSASLFGTGRSSTPKIGFPVSRLRMNM